MMNSSKKVFLTGVTGTLGKEIIKAFLQNTNDQLFLLIRRKNRFSHWDRARKILAAHGLEHFLGTRVQVMEGDITFPHLGLSSEDLELLTKQIQEFYHIAALTNLNGSQEECYRINLGGTEEALKIAKIFRESGKLERFFYFSTAFVAGSRQTYCSMEDELPEKPAHANFYEESKCSAERKVRQLMQSGFPITIFRPSIVVGDSRTGEVSEFNVIYPFMRLFAHGYLSKLPTRVENSFNIVPIDFVVSASLAIAKQKNSIGKAFHLVTIDPPTIGTLLKLKEEEYSQLPPIQIVPPERFKREELPSTEQFVFDMLQPYLGYLNDNLTFDATNTKKALEGTGITFPVTDYNFLRTLCQYASDAGYFITR